MSKKEKLTSKQINIYGIFDFKNCDLVYIDLSEEKVLFEYDLEGYDPNQYEILTLVVTLN